MKYILELNYIQIHSVVIIVTEMVRPRGTPTIAKKIKLSRDEYTAKSQTISYNHMHVLCT